MTDPREQAAKANRSENAGQITLTQRGGIGLDPRLDQRFGWGNAGQIDPHLASLRPVEVRWTKKGGSVGWDGLRGR